MTSDVVVITGAGGMGLACARRLGPGRRVLIGDIDDKRLDEMAGTLSDEGHAVTRQQLDVTDPGSVASFADTAAGLGRIRTVVHTAGLSPTMASSERVLQVDMIGTDRVLAAFLPLATDGTVAVCIASMAGYMAGLTPEREHLLATAPTDDLFALVGPVDDLAPGASYCIAKRVNHLRVQQAAAEWGKRGARVVTISPGIISTSMSQLELQGESGDSMRMQLEISPIDRIGTPEDIASAVEFLAGPAASFITGCDLRVDGGVTAVVMGMMAGMGM